MVDVDSRLRMNPLVENMVLSVDVCEVNCLSTAAAAYVAASIYLGNFFPQKSVS